MSYIKIITLISFILFASQSYAEKRIALVIGNATYQNSPLRNTVNDAISMAQALRSLGFKVVEKHNLNQRAMNQEIRSFGQRLLRSDVGLFYFAGHGMQVKGVNYLIPVGYNVKHEDEIQYEAVNANRILSKMESAKNNLNIIILDACRNNPFKRSFRSSASGLARMEAPRGTIISYATAPGKISSDGRGKNGLYTSHLLKHIRKVGITINDVFRLARVGVFNESKRAGNEQLPWEASSLLNKFCFAGCGKSNIPNSKVITSVVPPIAENEPVSFKSVETKKGHSKQWYIDRWKKQQAQSSKSKIVTTGLKEKKGTNSSLFRRNFENEVYILENNALTRDKKLTERVMDYYERRDAQAIYHTNPAPVPKKSKLNLAKAKCKKALKITEGDYFDVFNYKFRKKSYSDNDSQEVIHSCQNAYNLSRSAEYLYLTAIGYHKAQNNNKALEYLKASSKINSPEATRKLGIIYLTGSIMKPDMKLGKIFLTKAAKSGDLASRKILNQLDILIEKIETK